MCFAILRFHDGAVIDDHGEGAGNLPRDGQREIETPPGYEGNFDTRSRGGLNSASIGLRHLRSAIEQSSIDIERDQAHLMLAVRGWHFSILHAASANSAFRERSARTLLFPAYLTRGRDGGIVPAKS